MGGFRTIDLSDDVVKSRKIGAQEVKLGAAVHYTKLTDIDAAFIVFTSNASTALETTVHHPLGRVPTGIIPIRKDKAGVIYIGTGATARTAVHISVHSSVASTTVHAVVF